MKKGDLFAQSGLEIYAEIGLVIFFVVFVLVAASLLFMKRSEAEEIGMIPLDDDISPDSQLSNREHSN